MRVKLKDIGSDGLRLQWPLNSSSLRTWVGETGPPPQEAAGDVSIALTRNGARVFAHGVVRARMLLPCGRCLEPADVCVDSPLQVTFVPAPLAPQPKESELHGDDPDYCTYRGVEIDLGDLVREQVLLGIPFAPVCREECRGLCPRCGADRNRNSCACPADPVAVGSGRLRL